MPPPDVTRSMPDGANLHRARRVANPSHKLADPNNDGEIEFKTHQVQPAQELEAQHLRGLEKEKENDMSKRGASDANLSDGEGSTD